MQLRLLMILTLSLMILPVLAVNAAAQEVDCGTIVFTLTPNQGPAGSQVTASVSGAYENDSYDIKWDTTSGPMLASGTTDNTGAASDTITIPADATVGAHLVIYSGYDSDDSYQDCPQTFTVTATTDAGGVQPDAYTEAARTSMPSTGIFLLPAAGLLAAGAGLLLARRRS